MTERILRCPFGGGEIVIKSEMSEEELKALKLDAIKIQRTCADTNIYMCKCPISEFLQNGYRDNRNGNTD
jgi:hypothetical protein